MGGNEAGIDAPESGERTDHEAGADEEDEGERDFRGNEEGVEAVTRSAGAASGFAQDLLKVDTGGTDGGRESEDDAGGEREGDGKEDYTEVEGDFVGAW